MTRSMPRAQHLDRDVGAVGQAREMHCATEAEATGVRSKSSKTSSIGRP